MKSRSTWFLACMALADVLFFNVSILFYLNVYQSLHYVDSFMGFYMRAKPTLVLLNNWFSAASIWFAVMVTVERLLAIIRPLSVHLFWSKYRLWSVVVCVWVLTFLSQCYNWLKMRYSSMPDCIRINQTFHHIANIKPEHPMSNFVATMDKAAPFIVVVVPFFLMLVFNCWLILHLHHDRRDVNRMGSVSGGKTKTSDTERKITVMVVTIMFAFLTFTAPSAVLNIVGWFVGPSTYRGDAFRVWGQMANYLVGVSKILNFPLYCLSSGNFRAQFLKLVPKRFRRVSLGATTTFMSSLRSLTPTPKYSLVSTAPTGGRPSIVTTTTNRRQSNGQQQTFV
uniref:G-protein coupled receptors family 1 profile domain-containing protein n=1 Tax=Romanomermis culicivorax TaxID=13658 RepID=A0A915KZT2_ROMCU